MGNNGHKYRHKLNLKRKKQKGQVTNKKRAKLTANNLMTSFTVSLSVWGFSIAEVKGGDFSCLCLGTHFLTIRPWQGHYYF